MGVDITEEELAREAAYVPPTTGERQRRCGECVGCNAEECGICEHCLDMPKRGGKGLKKQPCMRRQCVLVRAGTEERLREREEEKEKMRERREEMREKLEVDRARRLEELQHERERRREAKEEARQEAKQAKLAAKALQAAERARLASLRRASAGASRHAPRHAPRPPQLPSQLTAFGWGRFSSLSAGCAIEVLGIDEGLFGGCFAAVVVEPTAAELRTRPRQPPALPPTLDPAAQAAAAAAAAAAAGTGEGSSSSLGAVAASGSAGAGTLTMSDTPEVQRTSPQLAPLRWVLAEFTDLYESEAADAPRLREWTSSGLLRLQPPRMPRAFLPMLRPGDRLQYTLDDTWWDVTLEAVRERPLAKPSASGGAAAQEPTQFATQFVVGSVLYAATHHAAAHELRPLWIMCDTELTALREESDGGVAGGGAGMSHSGGGEGEDDDGGGGNTSGDDGGAGGGAACDGGEDSGGQHASKGSGSGDGGEGVRDDGDDGVARRSNTLTAKHGGGKHVLKFVCSRCRGLKASKAAKCMQPCASKPSGDASWSDRADGATAEPPMSGMDVARPSATPSRRFVCSRCRGLKTSKAAKCMQPCGPPAEAEPMAIGGAEEGALTPAQTRMVRWRCELMAGTALSDGTEEMHSEIFMFADGVARGHGPYFHSASFTESVVH